MKRDIHIYIFQVMDTRSTDLNFLWLVHAHNIFLNLNVCYTSCFSKHFNIQGKMNDT